MAFMGLSAIGRNNLLVKAQWKPAATPCDKHMKGGSCPVAFVATARNVTHSPGCVPAPPRAAPGENTVFKQAEQSYLYPKVLFYAWELRL